MDLSLIPLGIPVLYLLVHFTLVSSSARTRKLRILLVDSLLIIGFLGLMLWISHFETNPDGLARFLLLWSPLIFIWWAYLWSRHTFFAFYPEGFCWDDLIIKFEERWMGQPSLWLSRSGNPVLSEILHFCYMSYYFYTPLLGIYLDVSGRLREFQEMSLAILVGYSVSYTMFALAPVQGPRWSLEKAGLISPEEQQQEGYCFTGLTNRIMYNGPAHKGGAMPSSHSSTAVIFLFWCWWLWGWSGGLPATLIVSGMWVGSIYGRYHFVIDVFVGGLIGLLSLYVASLLV